MATAPEMATASGEQLGLTSREAAQALLTYGPNDAIPSGTESHFKELLSLFLNPLAVILLIAAVLSAFLGEVISSGIIITVVLISIALNYAQTFRSERAMQRLRRAVSPTASVLRDQKWQEVLQREVVPGDVVRLSAGDLVPADARLLNSRDLFLQQAALTGESMPAEKDASAQEPTQTDPQAPNIVFLGTSVVSGMGTAIVLATGKMTAFGAIAEGLAQRPPETEFERALRNFARLVARTTIFLVLLILVLRIAFHKDAFESFLFAIALAVGLTPEFLPMITSVTLAQGALRMARAHVVVKQLSAIQNFGSIDVLCSDKTGTLTLGEMILERSSDPEGKDAELPFVLAYINSGFETGIRSPLDTAILQHGKLNISDYSKLDEIPFDFERRRVSVVVEEKSSSKRMLITKGAPESILGISNFYEVAERRFPFDVTSRQMCQTHFQELSSRGLRVLAVGYRLADMSHGFSKNDERELVFAGYVAFADPVRVDAESCLAALRRDGIHLKVITGDNELVARRVCEEVGINASHIVLGSELESMSDTALAQVAESTNVFARVSPMQKHRIILALKQRNHVVGYIGDGINDAPSIRAADVGISVASAVDVARDSAQVILLEPGLGVLHNGIIEGRRASANVLKYLLMGTSSNFGNMFSMAAASLFLPFLPMLPMQILLNNFLYDLAQITIPTDNVDRNYLRRPQRWDVKLIRNFMLFIGPVSSIFDFLAFFVLLHVFHADEQLFHTGWFVESLATQTLVLFVIRTRGNPFRSRPSPALTLTTLLVTIFGTSIPLWPITHYLGFTRVPISYIGFLVILTAVYLTVVEYIKRLLFSGFSSNNGAFRQRHS
jgi:Mg2+-importing ATPase